MYLFHTKDYHKRAVLLISLISSLAILLAACGSSSDSGGGDSNAGSADTAKTYASGVPTLDELYKSTEAEPPASGPPAAKGKSVIFVSCGQAVPGCAGPPNAMKSAAKALGWKYRIVDGQLNANNGWAAGIRQAIALKPDAIVVHGIGCADVKQPFVEAKAAGIPVVAIQSADCDDPLTPGGPSESLFKSVQFNKDALNASAFFKQWGATQAAYVVNATKGKAQVIMTAQPSQVFSQYQREGQLEVLKKCSGCKILKEIELTAGDAGPGGQAVQQFATNLVKYPNANAVILNYDGTAVSGGFSKAIVDAGRAKDMTVVAGEGYAEALQLIRDGGGLTADPAHSGEWLAWAAADSLNRLFNDKPLVPEGIGFRVIDKKHNMMPAGENYSPKLDFKTIYKKSWGVE